MRYKKLKKKKRKKEKKKGEGRRLPNRKTFMHVD
jgi:hypothetical protein